LTQLGLITIICLVLNRFRCKNRHGKQNWVIGTPDTVLKTATENRFRARTDCP
jgi:hypothetical protein